MWWDCLEAWFFRYFRLLFLGHPQLCDPPQTCGSQRSPGAPVKRAKTQIEWVSAGTQEPVLLSNSSANPGDSEDQTKHWISRIRAPARDHWCRLGLVGMKLRGGSWAQLLPWHPEWEWAPSEPCSSPPRPRGLKTQPRSADFWVLPFLHFPGPTCSLV